MLVVLCPRVARRARESSAPEASAVCGGSSGPMVPLPQERFLGPGMLDARGAARRSPPAASAAAAVSHGHFKLREPAVGAQRPAAAPSRHAFAAPPPVSQGRPQSAAFAARSAVEAPRPAPPPPRAPAAALQPALPPKGKSYTGEKRQKLQTLDLDEAKRLEQFQVLVVPPSPPNRPGADLCCCPQLCQLDLCTQAAPAPAAAFESDAKAAQRREQKLRQVMRDREKEAKDAKKEQEKERREEAAKAKEADRDAKRRAEGGAAGRAGGGTKRPRLDGGTDDPDVQPEQQQASGDAPKGGAAAEGGALIWVNSSEMLSTSGACFVGSVGPAAALTLQLAQTLEPVPPAPPVLLSARTMTAAGQPTLEQRQAAAAAAAARAQALEAQGRVAQIQQRTMTSPGQPMWGSLQMQRPAAAPVVPLEGHVTSHSGSHYLPHSEQRAEPPRPHYPTQRVNSFVGVFDQEATGTAAERSAAQARSALSALPRPPASCARASAAALGLVAGTAVGLGCASESCAEWARRSRGGGGPGRGERVAATPRGAADTAAAQAAAAAATAGVAERDARRRGGWGGGGSVARSIDSAANKLQRR